jgi:hypothetical protein
MKFLEEIFCKQQNVPKLQFCKEDYFCEFGSLCNLWRIGRKFGGN